MIFPSQEVLDGIFYGLTKTVVWQDINLLHKYNKSFYPSRFVDPSSDDSPLLILNGIVKIQDNDTKIKISLSKNYLSKNKGEVSELPIFMIEEVPEGYTIKSESFKDHKLYIEKLIPDYKKKPSLTNLVNTFSERFQKDKLFIKGADVVEAATRIINNINTTIQEGNRIEIENKLYDDLEDSLDKISDAMQQYQTNLGEVRDNYQDYADKQTFSYSKTFEDNLVAYKNLAKYSKTQEKFTQLVKEGKITVEQFLNLTRELAAMQFDSLFHL